MLLDTYNLIFLHGGISRPLDIIIFDQNLNFSYRFDFEGKTMVVLQPYSVNSSEINILFISIEKLK